MPSEVLSSNRGTGFKLRVLLVLFVSILLCQLNVTVLFTGKHSSNSYIHWFIYALVRFTASVG